MTTAFEQVRTAWREAFSEMSRSPGMERIARSEIDLEHYRSILTEIYYQVREHPPALARLTRNLRGGQRQLTASVLRHALSETGHDLLALHDLEALGADTTDVPSGCPLPATSALLTFMNELLDDSTPMAFLGYLFHLEFTPTHAGEHYQHALASAGIPAAAMTFIAEHAVVDIGHNKLMERYVEKLVDSEEELGSVIRAAQTTARLYGKMITEAIERIDQERLARRLSDRTGVAGLQAR